MRYIVLIVFLLFSLPLFSQKVSSPRTCYFKDVRVMEFDCITEFTTITITAEEAVFDSRNRFMRLTALTKDYRYQGDSVILQLYKAFYKDSPVTLGVETNFKGQVITIGILQPDYRFLVFLVNAKDTYL